MATKSVTELLVFTLCFIFFVSFFVSWAVLNSCTVLYFWFNKIPAGRLVPSRFLKKKFLAVICRRLCSLIIGLFPSTGRAQASVTASLNPGILVQNCSNLKVASLGWACWLHRKSGQWSDSELNRAWRPIPGNMADQSWLHLQNTRSKTLSVPMLVLSVHCSMYSVASAALVQINH